MSFIHSTMSLKVSLLSSLFSIDQRSLLCPLSDLTICNLVFVAELLTHDSHWWFVILPWKQIASALLWLCAAVSPCRQDCDTVTTTTSIDTSPTKELTNSVQLPVDEDDYLQPQSSKCSPAIYLDLLDSTSPVPGTICHCHCLLKLSLKNFYTGSC